MYAANISSTAVVFSQSIAISVSICAFFSGVPARAVYTTDGTIEECGEFDPDSTIRMGAIFNGRCIAFSSSSFQPPSTEGVRSLLGESSLEEEYIESWDGVGDGHGEEDDVQV
jgi:hypothetical protein